MQKSIISSLKRQFHKLETIENRLKAKTARRKEIDTLRKQIAAKMRAIAALNK